MMRGAYWAYATRAGVCAIRCHPTTGRCHVFIGDEDLGNYEDAQQALDALLRGHTTRAPKSGADTRTLGLPPTISDWEFVQRR
jgi:hypothetical protein